MIIYKGKHSGFCFGVKRAVDTALSFKVGNNFLLGEIIHNQSVNQALINNGLKIVKNEELESLPKGNLIIRTHGEPKATYDKANDFGFNIIDCTCPFVRNIQKIVFEKSKQGYVIVIIGTPNHPEVVGINGWCDNKAIITEDPDVINAINSNKVCVVVQTTFSQVKFNKIINKIDFTDRKTVDIFKTICYTTTERQRETAILSRTCDAMLVIGGANSNNTNELYELCKLNCSSVFRITNPVEFDYKLIKNYKRIGVVLGASTPIEQFQEVVSNMEKVTEEIITTQTISDEKQEAVQAVAEKVSVGETKKSPKTEMEAAFDSIKPNKDFKLNQVIVAKISSATDAGLTISIKNAKKDFELPASEILGEYKKENYNDKIGQDIRVMVVGKQPVRFSEKAMEKVLAEEAEIEEIRNGKIFEAEIVATNKGGLTGKFGRYEVFVPASQIKIGFVKDLDKYVGKTLRLKAEKIESRSFRKQIIGSQKVILEAEKAERDAIKAQKEAEFFGAIQEGDVVIGTPVRFVNFGAFIDVNGFDCLAHISDLSWTNCRDCAEVLEIGKQDQFVILKIDQENKRVSLGYKQLQPKPWESVPEKYAVGDVVKGKVVRLVDFGAFVEVEKGVDGLVHVSQISNQWLENPISALQVGQEVEAKILDINLEKEKMTLSIKALLPEIEHPNTDPEEGKGKGKKHAPKDDDSAENELREWKDDNQGGVSIAEMLGNSEN